MSDDIICKTRRFVATRTHLSSRASTFTLANVEHVRLRRPWLPFALIGAGGLAAIAWVFSRELYDHEQLIIWALAAAAIGIALRVARLELLSLALRDRNAVIWGPVGELRAVKSALETALMTRPPPHPPRSDA